MSQSIASARTRISLSSDMGKVRSPLAWIGALGLHAAIVAATLFTFTHTLDVADESAPMVPVDLVTIGARTNIAPHATIQPKAPPAPTPAPPAPLPPAPAVTPQPAEAVPPAETVLALKSPKATPQPQAKPAPTAPDKKKPQADPLAALLNKLTAPAAASAPDTKKSDRSNKGFGSMDRETASLVSALQSKIAPCWSPPIGAPHPERLVVTFELFLNSDGSVAQPPQLAANSAGGSDPYMRAAVEAARRAIQTCAPYKLPADSYGKWRDIEFTFDPANMAGAVQ
jgi:outer membrane biosynthesis protein TonB